MFKNWNEIAKVSDRFFMLFLATLEMESEIGKRIISAFPEFFSQKMVLGPYMLSLIKAQARKNALKMDGNEYGDEYPVTYEAVPEWIPIVTFDIFGNNLANLNGPRLPEGIDPKAKQGDRVCWNGKDFVVLETNSSEEMSLAPAELIFRY